MFQSSQTELSFASETQEVIISQMQEHREKRVGRQFQVVTIIGGILTLALLYVLGIGPACWLMEHGYISEELYFAVYCPIIIVANKFPPLANLLVAWMMLCSPTH